MRGSAYDLLASPVDEVLSVEIYSAGKNDECYTPAIGVLPLLKYMARYKLYWLPFDNEESEFVKSYEGIV